MTYIFALVFIIVISISLISKLIHFSSLYIKNEIICNRIDKIFNEKPELHYN